MWQDCLDHHKALHNIKRRWNILTSSARFRKLDYDLTKYKAFGPLNNEDLSSLLHYKAKFSK